MIPTIVLVTVAAMQGSRKSAGFAEPAAARMEMTVEGNICRLVAEMTTSIIMLVVAIALLRPRFIEPTAPIPMGVAAFPSPSRFALMFIETYFSVSALSPLNSRLTTGRSSRASLSAMPVPSRTSNRPSHIPYSATSVSASDTAPFAPVIIEERTADGSAKISAAIEISIIIIQMKAITIIKYDCVFANIII